MKNGKLTINENCELKIGKLKDADPDSSLAAVAHDRHITSEDGAAETGFRLRRSHGGRGRMPAGGDATAP